MFDGDKKCTISTGYQTACLEDWENVFADSYECYEQKHQGHTSVIPDMKKSTCQ